MKFPFKSFFSCYIPSGGLEASSEFQIQIWLNTNWATEEGKEEEEKKKERKAIYLGEIKFLWIRKKEKLSEESLRQDRDWELLSTGRPESKRSQHKGDPGITSAADGNVTNSRETQQTRTYANTRTTNLTVVPAATPSCLFYLISISPILMNDLANKIKKQEEKKASQ